MCCEKLSLQSHQKISRSIREVRLYSQGARDLRVSAKLNTPQRRFNKRKPEEKECLRFSGTSFFLLFSVFLLAKYLRIILIVQLTLPFAALAVLCDLCATALNHASTAGQLVQMDLFQGFFGFISVEEKSGNAKNTQRTARDTKN